MSNFYVLLHSNILGEKMTSFMFKSGTESLEQAIKHFQIHERTKESKHLRFGLIHLDGAIELILKESLKSKGIHFLRGKGSGWYGVFECLWEIREDINRKEQKKIFPKELSDILYLNEMELLHELRNSAQHIGVYHSKEQLQELVPKVLQALQAYLKFVFDLDISGLDEYLKNIGKEKDAKKLYLEEAEIAFNQGNLAMAFIQKHIVLENLLREILFIITNERIQSQYALRRGIANDLLSNEVFLAVFENPRETGHNIEQVRIIRMEIMYQENSCDELTIMENYITLSELIEKMQIVLEKLRV